MNPRDFALRELDARTLPNWPAKSLKGSRDGSAAPPADGRDLALAENIVIGVVKHALLLQHLIQYYSGRNLKSLDVGVQKILAIGLYQLRFLNRIPPSAAVDQAVEQTRRFGESRASGLVNAVLRKATRDPSPPLPDRKQAVEYARIVLSHPPELFKRLEKLLRREDAMRFCEHDQTEPPTIVRLARGIDPEMLAAPGVTILPHEHAGMYVVEGAKRSTFADWSARNIAQVQDPTSAGIVPCMQLEPGQVVLDRCCGMGTKTMQIHELLGESGRVVAIDASESRCAALQRLVEQRKVANVTVHCASHLANLPEQAETQFDRVLIDAPCSNSGVLARRAEARYFQQPHCLKSLGKLQAEILSDTAPFVKPGGLLIYSTCSIWPEENEECIEAFVAQNGTFERLQQQSTLPSLEGGAIHYRDGGFVAVLRRS